MGVLENLPKLYLAAVTFAIICVTPSLTSDLADAGDDLAHYEVKFGGNEQLRNSKGSFVLTEGLVLAGADSFYNLTVDNLCNCRMSCWSHASCQAASAEPFEGRLLCRLSAKAPMNTNLKTLRNAKYFFFTSAINNRFYGMQKDGFLYVFANYWGPYENSSTLCKKIPGHRLGRYETEDQLQAIRNLFQLVEDKKSQQIWTDRQQDGTNQYFKERTFASGHKEAYTVCQADPLGLSPRTDHSSESDQTDL